MANAQINSRAFDGKKLRRLSWHGSDVLVRVGLGTLKSFHRVHWFAGLSLSVQLKIGANPMSQSIEKCYK